MDFGIRELLMFIGALIFIGVLVDGVRRFQHNRKQQIKVKVDRSVSADDGDDDNIDHFSGELPSGGARLRSKDQEDAETAKAKIDPVFTEPVDILMENQARATVSEPADEEESLAVVDQERVSEPGEVIESEVFENEEVTEEFNNSEYEQSETENQRDLFGGSEAAPKSSPSTRGITAKQTDEPKVEESESLSETNDLPEEVLTVNVMAKPGQDIDGALLYESVSAFGLRFGDMGIFHRHEHSTGQGPVIFSMANAINPGTFNADEFEGHEFKGVTFFMRLSQVNKRIFVLELMLDIAKRLATQLDAELKDDTHSVLSSQTITHYKSRIQEYERRYLGQVLRK